MLNKIFRKKKKLISSERENSEVSYFIADDQDEELIHERGLDDLHSFRALYKYANPHIYELSFALGLIFVSSLLAVISAKFIGDLIERGLLKEDLKRSIIYAAIVVVLESLSIFLTWNGRKKLGNTSSLIIFKIRQNLFSKLQVLPMKYFDRQPQGRIVTRVTHDVEGIEEFFTSGLGNMVSAFMMTLLALSAMLFSNLKLGLIMTLSIIPAVIVVIWTKNVLRDSNRRVSKFSSSVNSKLSEYINGLETIRSFGLENWTMEKYNRAVDDYLFAQLRGNLLFAWSMPLVSFLATLPLIGLVWFGGRGVIEGTYSVGLFVAFVRYFERFFNPMMLLSREIHIVQQAFNSIERVMSFLNEADEDQSLKSKGALTFNHFEGDIKYIDVSMSYDNETSSSHRMVLNHLNFHILPGEKIGLVGKTGCGKSSTIALLARLYEFQNGEILIDDIPIRNIDRNNLRDKIGFVSQEVVIFNGTLRENLSSNRAIDDQVLLDAAKETGLVRALVKEGFDLNMSIVEGGSNLSVGQRQLISLTRVLLKRPSILVLDEATANIDPFFEELIHQAVMKMMEGRTCLIIAHRLDTLKQCHRVFVFKEGKIVEEGPLHDLINCRGEFYNLHHAQSLH